MPRTLEKTRNFHVPLEESLYQKLRDEAALQKQPATVLARAALEAFLLEHHRARIAADLKAFAETYAGTNWDLDPELEAAGIESLLANTRWDEEQVSS